MCAKPTVAFYWCAACGGCDEAVVDLAEDILGLVAAVDIVLWPVAMDFKKHDVESMPDGSIDATLLNGAVRTSEQEEMARLLRRKSRVLIAYGACAISGGIPGLANQTPREELLRYVYEQAPTMANAGGVRPRTRWGDNGHTLTLPEFRGTVRALDQVVEVDYYVPGCPPPLAVTRAALNALLEGKLPPKGSVLAPDVALCEQCPRRDTKPADLSLAVFLRPHLVATDPEKCLLAQGLACLGPATRSGCEAACIRGNMPCTGCGGPTSQVHDHGAKILSFLASTLAGRDDPAITRGLAGRPDPVGTCYRYGLAASALRGRVDRPSNAPSSS